MNQRRPTIQRQLVGLSVLLLAFLLGGLRADEGDLLEAVLAQNEAAAQVLTSYEYSFERRLLYYGDVRDVAQEEITSGRLTASGFNKHSRLTKKGFRDGIELFSRDVEAVLNDKYFAKWEAGIAYVGQQDIVSPHDLPRDVLMHIRLWLPDIFAFGFGVSESTHSLTDYLTGLTDGGPTTVGENSDGVYVLSRPFSDGTRIEFVIDGHKSFLVREFVHHRAEGSVPISVTRVELREDPLHKTWYPEKVERKKFSTRSADLREHLVWSVRDVHFGKVYDEDFFTVAAFAVDEQSQRLAQTRVDGTRQLYRFREGAVIPEEEFRPGTPDRIGVVGAAQQSEVLHRAQQKGGRLIQRLLLVAGVVVFVIGTAAMFRRKK